MAKGTRHRIAGACWATVDGYVVGWKSIGEAFGATGKSARAWRRAGAPILLLGEKPVTRRDDLWYWLLDHRTEAGDGPDVSGMSAAAAKKVVPESGEAALVAAVLGGTGNQD